MGQQAIAVGAMAQDLAACTQGPGAPVAGAPIDGNARGWTIGHGFE
jgi:hypothetical protein